MELEAIARGEWPNGVHWTAGEVRDVAVPEGEVIPAFLKAVKKAKKAKKAKA
jgi:hypothetical protein|tara:strand:+ start:36 stop:191 length:156 start_codon:yes stop_codon:yes gene_type:complete